MGRDYAVQIASGRDGRILSRWKTEWPETPRSFTVGQVQSFAPPLGDFDGDGLADLLLVRESRFYDFEPYQTPLVANGTMPLMMQALSGKTGKAVWRGGSVPLPDWFRPTNGDDRSPEWQQARYNHLQNRVLHVVDLDGDARPELLLIVELNANRRDDKQAGQIVQWKQQIVSLVDGRDGSVRWAKPLAEPLVGNHQWLNVERGLRIDASADLNGDGTRDVVLFVPSRTPDGLCSGALQARNGLDGKLLWPEQAVDGKWFNDDGLKQPLIGDLEGDGLPELVLLASREPMVVKVLRGDTGETLWTWSGVLPPYSGDPSVVIVANFGSAVARHSPPIKSQTAHQLQTTPEPPAARISHVFSVIASQPFQDGRLRRAAALPSRTKPLSHFQKLANGKSLSHRTTSPRGGNWMCCLRMCSPVCRRITATC